MELDKDHCIKMNDGNKIPAVGFGTYCPDASIRRGISSKEKEVLRRIYGAGETHLNIVKKRQERASSETTVVFESLQLWSTFHRPELVRSCLEQSLKKLKFDYLDLFIIHNPMSLKPGTDTLPKDENGKFIFDVVDLRQTWEAMEACKDAGLVKSIGVSNFNIRQLEMILNKPGLKYKPVLNQSCLLGQVFDFQLSEEDMKTIDGMNLNRSYVHLEQFLGHPQFPFRDE
ncbi:aldo-keto reductase family 1 member C3-like [Chelonoidis abingdonii]|uniref:aldo-keto reductase family 1 member C3-like n=1 Tax=Chelonoidis abingdonii TaxID=106734 RepID=UPI003F4957D8